MQTVLHHSLGILIATFLTHCIHTATHESNQPLDENYIACGGYNRFHQGVQGIGGPRTNIMCCTYVHYGLHTCALWFAHVCIVVCTLFPSYFSMFCTHVRYGLHTCALWFAHVCNVVCTFVHCGLHMCIALFTWSGLPEAHHQTQDGNTIIFYT